MPVTEHTRIAYPMLIILQICGINSCNLKTSRRCPFRSFYSLCVTSILLVQYSMNIIDFALHRRIDQVELLKMITAFMLFGSEMLSAVCSTLVSFFRYDEVMKVIRKLLEIDKSWQSIDTRMRYSEHSTLKILKFLLFMFSCLLMDFIVFFTFESRKVRSIIIMRYSSRLVSWVNIWYFLSVLKIIRGHFKQVNDELVALVKLMRTDLLIDLDIDVGMKVKILCKIHRTLRKLCRLHNSLYGLQITFLAVFFTSVTTAYMYFLIVKNIKHFNHTDKGTPILASYAYLVAWTVVYFVLCYGVLDSIVNTEREVSFLVISSK